MRAAVVTAVNGPWEVQNVPEPKPGPNQVLVKMHASGVCYTRHIIRLGLQATQVTLNARIRQAE